ncbi:MAG: hypothetical protein KKB20_18945 [Proteobacteria bacterium]|nr:hypothetical protein [Pseudomonadota bacterium]
MNELEARERLRKVLQWHIGEEKAIGADRLQESVYGTPVRNKINDTRQVRRLIERLRREGEPIGSTSSQQGGGYYLIGTRSELTDYCRRHQRRALASLDIVANILKVSLSDLLVQMQFGLGGGTADRT